MSNDPTRGDTDAPTLIFPEPAVVLSIPESLREASRFGQSVRPPEPTTFKEGEPHFKHDCVDCRFLGHYVGRDLYVCGEPEKESSSISGTVIARWSDAGCDYSSGWCFGASIESSQRHLAEAVRRYLLVKYAGVRLPWEK